MPAPLQPELLREDYAELNVLFVHSKIDDSGLSVFAFRVYAHLARRASASGCAWPSIATIARVCRMGETKVREALRELVDRRLIDRQPRENQTYVFRLTPPSLWLAVAPTPVRAAIPPPLSSLSFSSSFSSPLAAAAGNEKEKDKEKEERGENTPPAFRPPSSVLCPPSAAAPGFAPRTPSPREPVRPAPPPPSLRAPEGSPVKEIADPVRADPVYPDPDRTAPEAAARDASRRELARTLPASLDTPEFRAAWEKWVVHWTLTFHAPRGQVQPMPFATADAHLELCRRLGPARALAAIANAISRRLREPAEPFAPVHAPARPGNTRRFAQSGDYAHLTDK